MHLHLKEMQKQRDTSAAYKQETRAIHMANKNIVRLRDRQISEGIYLTWFMILLQARYIIPDLRKQKDCNNKDNLNLEMLSYITDHLLTRIIRQPSYAHLMVLFYSLWSN
jgi:hypothetical protein